MRSIVESFDTHAANYPVALFQNATVSGQGQIPWTSETVPASLTVQDETVPVQVVEAFGERSLVFPVPQAALGTVAVGDLGDTVAPRPRLKASNRRIENAELSVRFDANGNITSIQSLEDGTEYVEPGKLANLFQLLDDKPLFWSAWDVDVFAFETAQDLVRSESFEIVERGPVRAAVELVKRFGSSTIRQRISLGPWPGIRFDTEVDWREEDKMLKVAFPINVNAARATYEIQFGNVERPTHVNTTWDQAKFEVCAQKWVDISEAEGGVALINDGKYGHDTRGNVVRLSLLRSPKAPDPLCDMGVHRFSYQLLPHPGAYHHAEVVRHAYAFNAELRSLLLEPVAGEGSGALPPFVSVDGKSLVIEAVKKAEDNDDLIVRLYECHNTRGRALLSSALEFRSAYLCDLEETPIGDLESNSDGVTIDYKPFEIITVRLAR
ncbi:MAG: hypothetical protein EON58_10980 [Alphaproteobacteria bacterium]|nr:MAG: hypothetical protein EON58_10980 [Alphaproteobacteria bacterium]